MDADFTMCNYVYTLDPTKLADQRLSVNMISEQVSNLEHSIASIHPQDLIPRYEHDQNGFMPVESEVQKQKTVSEPNRSLSSENNIDDIDISQGNFYFILYL